MLINLIPKVESILNDHKRGIFFLKLNLGMIGGKSYLKREIADLHGITPVRVSQICNKTKRILLKTYQRCYQKEILNNIADILISFKIIDLLNLNNPNTSEL